MAWFCTTCSNSSRSSRATARTRQFISAGPVEPRRGFVLHSRDWGGQDTLDVAGRWSLSSTVDVLRAIAGEKGPSRWLVALGYAGWGEGQLDVELTGAGWLNVGGDDSLLWHTPAPERWRRGYEAQGIDPRLLAHEVGRP